MQNPRASDSIFSRAMRLLKWTQPVSSVPVAPWVQPVVLVGGDAAMDVRQRSQYASSTSLGVSTYLAMFTVPDGKQWDVRSVTMRVTTAAGDSYPATRGVATNQVGTRISEIVAAQAAGYQGSVYTVDLQGVSGSTKQMQRVLLGPGETIGMVGSAAAFDMGIAYLETDAPT